MSSQASEVNYIYHTMFTTLRKIQTQSNGKREILERIVFYSLSWLFAWNHILITLSTSSFNNETIPATKASNFQPCPSWGSLLTHLNESSAVQLETVKGPGEPTFFSLHSTALHSLGWLKTSSEQGKLEVTDNALRVFWRSSWASEGQYVTNVFCFWFLLSTLTDINSLTVNDYLLTSTYGIQKKSLR